MRPGKVLLLCLACLAVGAAAGRVSKPARVVTEVKVVEVEKVTVLRAEAVRDRSRTTVTRVEEGGRTSTTTVTENHVDTVSREEREEDRAKLSESRREETSAPRWYAGLLLVKPLNLQTPVSYGANVSYRFLGPFSAGVGVMLDGTAVGTLGLGF